jgi:hypothetical protein
MSAQTTYSPEASRLSLDIFRAVLEATTEHTGDEDAIREAATVAREQLVCRIFGQHGHAQGKVIASDAMALLQLLVAVLSEHFGLPESSPAA